MEQASGEAAYMDHQFENRNQDNGGPRNRQHHDSGRGRRGNRGQRRGRQHFYNSSSRNQQFAPRPVADAATDDQVSQSSVQPDNSTAAILAAISAREQQYSRGGYRRQNVPPREQRPRQFHREFEAARNENVQPETEKNEQSKQSHRSERSSSRRNENLKEKPSKPSEGSKLENDGPAAPAPRPKKTFPAETKKVADDATQRERLTEQMTAGKYECMVCCERVRQEHAIWNCSQCFHAFHLGCIKRWARASQDETSQWRCPGCQHVTGGLPNVYRCFCGKRREPEWNRRDIPHSCGEVCGKVLGSGSDSSCTHSCTLLCHPGPCPPCSAQVNRRCPCGKTSKIVKCGSSIALTCTETCSKSLACGLHFCNSACHTGPCPECSVPVKQVCHCGSSDRVVVCQFVEDPTETFCCEKPCQKKLSCGNHTCDQICHKGACSPCPSQVDKILTCPCGKKNIEQLLNGRKRTQCTDPVPTCREICGKSLLCGHECRSFCHKGPCSPCEGVSSVKCRCGRNEKEISCQALIDLGPNPVTCERRCNKKRQCGKHKCVNQCCVDAEHICPMLCGRQLNCGLHRCEDLCHTGNCKPCLRASFEELYCHCGSQVMYPPIPCGQRPPECDQPCSRPRRCGHAPSHLCHPEAHCPPCTVLCEKWCYGGHELRKNVPCHVQEVSCGKPCGKPLPCGRHGCILPCHTGPCPTACAQPCQTVRAECGHPCGAPCHDEPCPSVACREKVKVQCQCGQRQATVSCEEQQSAYRKIATALLASKMAALQSGESVDMTDLLGAGVSSKKDKSKSLECNEECALVERNRRLALALQIRNPDPKPGAPRYPDILKDWVKKDARFAQMVHDKLSDVVQLAKQSVGKQRSRSHSFDPMNRDKRQFIHEYCAFFGCESVSYDEEPKRNVVVTAFGETSFLPAVSVVEVVQREMGQRKVPAPPSRGPAPGMTLKNLTSKALVPQAAAPSAWGRTAYKTLSDVVKAHPPVQTPSPAAEAQPAKQQPVIDYFDFTS